MMPVISKAVKPRRKCRLNLVTGEYDELYKIDTRVITEFEMMRLKMQSIRFATGLHDLIKQTR